MARYWFIVSKFSLLDRSVKMYLGSLHFFSCWSAWRLCQQRELERHCRWRFCFPGPRCSWWLWQRFRLLLCPTLAVQGAQPHSEASFSQHAHTLPSSFIAECLWWDISPWTAFLAPWKGRCPASFQQHHITAMPLPCTEPWRRQGLALTGTDTYSK